MRALRGIAERQKHHDLFLPWQGKGLLHLRIGQPVHHAAADPQIPRLQHHMRGSDHRVLNAGALARLQIVLPFFLFVIGDHQYNRGIERAAGQTPDLFHRLLAFQYIDALRLVVVPRRRQSSRLQDQVQLIAFDRLLGIFAHGIAFADEFFVLHNGLRK